MDTNSLISKGHLAVWSLGNASELFVHKVIWKWAGGLKEGGIVIDRIQVHDEAGQSSFMGIPLYFLTKAMIASPHPALSICASDTGKGLDLILPNGQAPL